MNFELLPLLETMINLYQQPPTSARFQNYLGLLRGNTKDELVLPIGGFNPMAKPHVLEELLRLHEMKIEEIMTEVLREISKPTGKTIKVGFCLSDDLMGGWTNRYTSDLDSKFKINALIQRDLCSVVFWTCEKITLELIRKRTWEYCYRTIFWQGRDRLRTLTDFVEQEVFVARNLPDQYKEVEGEIEMDKMGPDYEKFRELYQQFGQADEMAVLLNFMYGDQAAINLGNKPMGIPQKLAGYKFANWLAVQAD